MSTLLIPSSIAGRTVLPEEWELQLAVAVDGFEPSDVALLAGRALAGTTAVRVITVLTGRASEDSSGELIDPPQTPESVLALIGRQLGRVFGDAHGARIELHIGYPPAVLASFAELQSVPLLVVGVGHPRVLDRLAGDEFVLRLARMARTPVLVVAPNRAMPPRRIVVATDFGETAMRAARLALAVAAPNAEILLTHVKTPVDRAPNMNALQRHADALQTGFCGRVRPIALEGNAATELLAFANANGADAIAIGTHGDAAAPYGVSGTLGSVATRVVRCSSSSLIIAPRDYPKRRRFGVDG